LIDEIESNFNSNSYLKKVETTNERVDTEQSSDHEDSRKEMHREIFKARLQCGIAKKFRQAL